MTYIMSYHSISVGRNIGQLQATKVIE